MQDIDRNFLSREDYEALMGRDWPSFNDFKNGCEIPMATKVELENIFKASTLDENLSEREKFLLTQSKHFCMLPWIHLHSSPTGKILPCCYASPKHPVGNSKENTFKEIWNNDSYKSIRKNMLQDKWCQECDICYEAERFGIVSKRNESNKYYRHYINEVMETNEDGSTNNFKIRYLDIRFSNLCNFKCRTCGPEFSSNWYQDYTKLNKQKNETTIHVPIDDEDILFEQLEPHIPYLEEIYFAGGEPLIMKEHYRLLDKLVEYGKTDVRLLYNTNFSEMHYKDKYAFDYWPMFKDVRVHASLDASGTKAEYIRKGTNWDQTINNRKLMIQKTPNVKFWITPTISAMNVLHVLDFHKQMVDQQIITSAEKVLVHICLYPEHFRPNIFPKDFKDSVIIPAYEKHIEWLKLHDSYGECTKKFINLLNFIRTDPDPTLYNKFLNTTNKIDSIRNENFWETFPELTTYQQ